MTPPHVLNGLVSLTTREGMANKKQMLSVSGLEVESERGNPVRRDWTHQSDTMLRTQTHRVNLQVDYDRKHHWGRPHEATVVKMAPTRPLASRSFCLLAPLCDHRSLSNLQQSNTRVWYTLHQIDRLVPFVIFVQ